MRILVLALCLASCQFPDRWSVSTGVGDGDLETPYAEGGSRDMDSSWVEVGVSGALGTGKETGHAHTPHQPISPPASPVGLPVEPSGLPWTELAILLSGAGAWKASEYGYQRVQRYRRKPQS